MTEKFSRWDAADDLKTDEDIVQYFDICLEEDPGDGSLIRRALGSIARAKGMTQLARDTGISREGLYRELSADGNPEFGTVMKVIRALGVKLHAEIDHAWPLRARVRCACPQSKNPEPIPEPLLQRTKPRPRYRLG